MRIWRGPVVLSMVVAGAFAFWATVGSGLAAQHAVKPATATLTAVAKPATASLTSKPTATKKPSAKATIKASAAQPKKPQVKLKAASTSRSHPVAAAAMSPARCERGDDHCRRNCDAEHHECGQRCGEAGSQARGDCNCPTPAADSDTHPFRDGDHDMDREESCEAVPATPTTPSTPSTPSTPTATPTSSGQLPFTGENVLGVIALGLALFGGGLVARRRLSRSQG